MSEAVEPMNFRDKLNSDYYKARPEGEKPPRPVKPALLSKPAGDLSRDELDSVEQVKKQYESDMTAYNAYFDRWRVREGQLAAEFFHDLMANWQLDETNKFVLAMYSKAYETGHSCGLSEVAGEFADLMSLLYSLRDDFGMTDFARVKNDH